MKRTSLILPTLFFVLLLGAAAAWAALPNIPSTNEVVRYERGFRASQPQIISKDRGDGLPAALDGQPIYDIEVCEVHKAKMEHKEVRIAYGLIRPDKNDPAGHIERRLFPHHREYSLGGCVIESDSPKTRSAYVCSECQQAYDKWRVELRLQEANVRQKILSAPKPCVYKMGTIDDGGTLSSIAKMFYGDASKWKQIYEANRKAIKNPNEIRNGMKLTIPEIDGGTKTQAGIHDFTTNRSAVVRFTASPCLLKLALHG